jgi:phosphatidylethanolamine/phosphatidyl-N-methylethanolamine N-methyltransferase
VEKNLEAFLALDLPGTKVVVGDGPQRAQLARNIRTRSSSAKRKGEDLRSHLAAADVFVFPSLTDTFGVVQLEALACGTPVAAFPVTGPVDVIADLPIGAPVLGSAQRLPARADDVARGLSQFRARAIPGENRPGNSSAIWPAAPSAHAPARRIPAPARCRVNVLFRRETAEGKPWQTSSNLTAPGRWTSTAERRFEQAYDRWARLRPRVRRRVQQGRRAAIAAPPTRIGGRVLEVGVGTGISLPLYGTHLRIFGTDISESDAAEGKKRVDELGLKNVEGLAVMDAEKLEFPDNSFDVVMAQYVVTACRIPEAALDEFARVLRPGGELIILTRVSAGRRHAPLHRAALQPVVRPLGFRTAEFAWSRYAQWLAGARGMELAERRLVPPLGHFSLVRFRKVDVAGGADAARLRHRVAATSYDTSMMSYCRTSNACIKNHKDLGETR